MQITGTWNSDYAILFFFLLIAPIAIHFLGAVLGGFSQNRALPKRSKPSKPRNQNPPSINISVSLPKSKKSTATKIKQKPKKKAKPRPKSLTSDEIINDSISALYSLGTDKREATRIVKSLSSKKEYNSAESLIKDALCV